MPRSLFRQLPTLNPEMLRRFLSPETVETLTRRVADTLTGPTKADLEDAGQGALPFLGKGGDDGVVDYLPSAYARQQNTQDLSRDLEQAYPEAVESHRPTPGVGPLPLWDAAGTIDRREQSFLPPAPGRMPTLTTAAAPSGPRFNPSVTGSGGPVVPPEYVDRDTKLGNTIVLGEDDPRQHPKVDYSSSENALAPWAQSSLAHQGDVADRLEAHQEVIGLYGDLPESSPFKSRGPLEAWDARREAIPLTRRERVPVETKEQIPYTKGVINAIDTRQDPKKFSKTGSYEFFDIPGGEGARHIDFPEMLERLAPPSANPGIEIPRLSQVAKAIGKKTGTGLSSSAAKYNQPFDPEVQEALKVFTAQTGIEANQVQMNWDRLLAEHDFEPETAKAQFLDFLGSIQEVAAQAAKLKANPRTAPEVAARINPQRAAQAHFAKAKGLTPGMQAGGWGDYTELVDTDHANAQLAERMNFGERPGYTGSPTEIVEADPKAEKLDIKSNKLVGHTPLYGIRRVPKGKTRDDQVSNIVKGLTDVMVVPRGTLTPGVHRIGTKNPVEVEILEVMPLHKEMHPGYLEGVSRRSGLPTRTFQDAVDLGDQAEQDIVRVRPLEGHGEPTPLPNQAWRRHPDSYKFWSQGQEGPGKEAKERLDSMINMRDALLRKPGGGRVAMTTHGWGKQILGIYTEKGQMIGVGPKAKDGSVPKYKLRRAGDNTIEVQTETGAWKAVAPNLFEGVGPRQVVDPYKGLSQLDSVVLSKGLPVGIARPESKDAPTRYLPLGRDDKGRLTFRGNPLPEKYQTNPKAQIGSHEELQNHPSVTPANWEAYQRESNADGMRVNDLADMSQDQRGGPELVGLTAEEIANTQANTPPELRGAMRAPDARGEKGFPDRTLSRVPSKDEVKDFVAQGDVTPTPMVEGLRLSPTPTRDDLSGVTWTLAKPPKAYGSQAYTAGPKDANLPLTGKDDTPKLRVIFTDRNPVKDNIDQMLPYVPPKTPKGKKPVARGPELVNPTPDTLRHVLAHSGVDAVQVEVQTGERLGQAKGTWNRARAVLSAVRAPDPGTGLRPGFSPVGRTVLEDIGAEVQHIRPEEALSANNPADRREILDRIRWRQRGDKPSGVPKTSEPTSTEKRSGFYPLAPADRVRPQAGGDIPGTDRAWLDQKALPSGGVLEESHQQKAGDILSQMQLANAKMLGKPSGRRKALASILLAAGGSAIPGLLPGDEKGEAEAAPRSLIDKRGMAKAAREAIESDTYAPSWMSKQVTKLLNYFEPVYETARSAGIDDQALRETIQTAAGGTSAKAQVRYEPVRQIREAYDKDQLTPAFTQYLTIGQGLKQWDDAAAKRDTLIKEAQIDLSQGMEERARIKQELAQELDNRMARKHITEFKATKEELMDNLHQLHAEVGPAAYARFQQDEPVVYKAIQDSLAELHREGLIPDESYQDYLQRGADHIPGWRTAYQDDGTPEAKFTGGNVFETVSTSIDGTTEQLIKEQMGSENILKDPLSNVAKFVTEAAGEVDRTRIARKVVDTFSQVGLAKEVDPDITPKAPEGFDHYTFRRDGKDVTYELPNQVVASLTHQDNEFARETLPGHPGKETLGTIRSIAEAGVTTLSPAWALKQALWSDPAAALTNAPTPNGKTFSRMVPYYRDLLVSIKDNLQSEWLGKASSPLRKDAAEAGVLHSGASTRFNDFSDIEGRDTEKRMEKALAQGKYGAYAREGIRKGLNWTGRLSKPLEEANKMATFKMLREAGLTDAKAAYYARVQGGSPDWAQKGNADKWVRTTMAFGRPQLLGVQQSYRSAKENPKKYAMFMGAMLAAETARQGLIAQTASEIGLTSEELENRYSEFDQDNTYLIPMPPSIAKQMGVKDNGLEIGANGTERPYAVKVPIPPNLRLWSAPFRGIAKAWRSGNPADLPIEGALGVIDESVPGSVSIEPGKVAETLGRRAMSVLPAPFRVPVEQQANIQAFTGAPIVGGRIEHLPAEDQWTTSTEPFYRSLGKAAGLSPARLQHGIKNLLPGPAQLIPQIFNATGSGMRSEDGRPIEGVEQSLIEKLNSTPLLGEFTKQITPQRYEDELSQGQDDLYGLSERTKSGIGKWNDYAKGVSPTRPSGEIETLAAFNPQVQGVVRFLSEISEQQKILQVSPDYTAREKRDAMKALAEQKREVLKSFLGDPMIKGLVSGEMLTAP